MLSAKRVRVHNMWDERWTTRDKLHQYRGILKLNVRDKKLRALELSKLKQKVTKNLKTLQLDVKEYRRIVNHVVSGNKVRVRATLQRYDENFHLAFGELSTDDVHERIYQDSDLKRRQLDKLRYEKERRAKFFFDLQLEKCVLLEEEDRESQTDRLHQRLTAELQRSTAKQNGAKAIRTTYRTMIDILKKDAVYFDALLQALKDDRKDQCKVIITATIMGQLAAENVDDLEEKYKRMTRDILHNMKERERTLTVARERVADLWEYAKSLVRVESIAALVKDTNDSARSKSNALESQLLHLEKICEKLQDTVLVRTHNELFPRLEEQTRQKARLIAQFNYNVKERDDLVSKKDQSLVTLESLQHSMVATTGQYRIDKKAMLEEIEVQKKREADYKELRKTHGELSTKIRAALQNMLLMLVCIKRGGKGGRKDRRRLARRTEQTGDAAKELDEKETDEPVLEEIEPDGLTLLAQVSRKMGALFGMSSFELDEEREERARQLYQSYVADYSSNLRFGKDESEQGLIVEHEIVDPSVLTRADVKTRSRKVVEANIKPE